MVEIKGGDKLAAVLEEMSRKVSNAATLQVGFMEDATEPDGTPIAMIAAIQEFGAPSRKIPPRPFFRTMVAEKSGEWGETVASLLAENDYDSVKVLKMMGQGIADQLQQSIIDTSSPPLSPITVMLRHMRSENPNLIVTGATVGEAAARVKAGKSSGGASTKPLVDSGNMLRAVTFKVE